MKRLLLIFLACLILAVSGGAIASAASTFDALYRGIVRVTNTGTAVTGVSTNFTASSSDFIAGGFMNSAATNTAITLAGIDVPYMPGFGDSNPWAIFVNSIGANSIQDNTFYSGGATDMAAKIRYFPGAGGMAVSDAAALEPGANFTFNIAGWVDTDNSSYTVDWFSPIDWVDPDAAWVNEAQAVDNATGTAATTAVAPGINVWSSYLHLNHTGIFINGFRFYVETEISELEVDLFYDNAWNNVYSADPPAGWTNIPLDHVRWLDTVRIRTKRTTNDIHSFYESDFQEVSSIKSLITKSGALEVFVAASENITATISDNASVSSASVASGEHDISIQGDNQSDVWATGNVLYFDGSSDSSIDLGNIYDSSAKFWVSFWCNFDSISGDYLFSKDAGAGDRLILYQDGANLRWRRLGSVDDWNIAVSPITTATWHHVLASVSDVNGVRFILDGGTASTDVSVAAMPAGGNIILGNIATNGADPITGEMMNVIMGIDDLSTAEEAALFNGIAPGDETDYWYIDEATGVTIISYGSQANAGTADSNTSWQIATYTGSDGTGRLSDCILSIDDTSNRAGINTFGKGISIPDNATDWTYLTNFSMPYMETANVTIAGTLQGSWTWEYAATFTDASGQSHTATPTFRTTSSDADVSAELINFRPVEEARAPAFSTNITTSGWITQADTVTGNFTTTTNSTYPGSLVVRAITTEGDTPIQLFEIIMAGVIMLALSFGVSRMMKRSREGSLLFKVLIIAAGLGVLIAVSIIDEWIIYLFLMIAIALVMASSQRTFTGTGNSGNNMIGFLSMAFVGMTIINRILEGRFLQSTDVDIVRNVLAFQPFEVFGIFTIPVPNTNFLLNGLPALMRWDYSFFGGNAQIFQYLLYSITAVVSFILLVLVFGAVYQMFSRGR